ncbi:MAG TPA: aminotransferase class V-fold PLP-dependent enzyme [Cyclobacteriaceae bacterium]|nr:aminotransferase class V-fold PLP-dependent enzyme [Cyclobacteriaceae bacterium]
MKKISSSRLRLSPIEMGSEEFRKAGYKLIDDIASFLQTLPERSVTKGDQPTTVQNVLGKISLPQEGTNAPDLLEQAAKLLFDHSLFNGHPRFWGYITSSASPIGALADLLAAAVNPNVGAHILSPMATEIERQTIQWIAELIGYPSSCGGIFVSGGNMANFIGFLAGRKSKAAWEIRANGLSSQPQMIVYCSKGTHTWIQKAADVFGLGTNNIRWIEVNEQQQMNTPQLEDQIEADKKHGYQPITVVGTAGSVGTGSIDSLHDIAEICERHNLWFHVDGAYGAPAAALPELASLFKGMERADSIALDPHKWLYSPLEAGCTLVRDINALHDTFTFHPEYYKFDGTEEDPVMNFHEFGLQNSRGFRALKVWLGLKQVGKNGYVEMIRDDITLAKKLFDLADQHPELEAVSNSLSITTFRYLPKRYALQREELNKLNEELLSKVQEGGEAFLSNAVVNGKYCLRACIVNFRTSLQDIEALIEIVTRLGRGLVNQRQQQ